MPQVARPAEQAAAARGAGGGSSAGTLRFRRFSTRLVLMEVTRRWSPVATLRSSATEVWRAAAGEKAEEEKLRCGSVIVGALGTA